jgi:hypothetical protein
MIARLVEQKSKLEMEKEALKKDKDRSVKLRNGERGSTSLLNM